jgi:putative DNA methylase
MTYRRKLIEVALPLEAINKESAREKSIRHGHPSSLHTWWSRKPLAACRAVLFASLIDDPSEYCNDENTSRIERERLFSLIEDLVVWENVDNEEILDKARLEIARSVARDLDVEVPVGEQAIREFLATKAPPVLDPFAGGGSIPLEAQRLGLRAYASDLNPVAVLINKASIEFPYTFADLPPVHHSASQISEQEAEIIQTQIWQKDWTGTGGIAEDVSFYGKWIRDYVKAQIGSFYPPVKITPDLLKDRPDLIAKGVKAGDEFPVISWLWARTVTCPNPACGIQAPLASKWILSKKKGILAWSEPFVDRRDSSISFKVREGTGQPPHGTVVRNGANCLACGTPIPFEYIREEGKAGRLGYTMTAIAAEGKKGRIYFPPIPEHQAIAKGAQPKWRPDTDLPEKALGYRVQLYGMTQHHELFTSRQLVALTAFSDAIQNIHSAIEKDALNKGFPRQGNKSAKAYADGVCTYLAFILDKQADLANSLSSWEPVAQCPRHLFSRQAVPMSWDFAEGNPIGNSSGSWTVLVENQVRSLQSPHFSFDRSAVGLALQHDAATPFSFPDNPIVSTDPPYYDNIGYADLSDFFYIWLRRSLAGIYPELFQTLLVPKATELIAAPHRFLGDKKEAQTFFQQGLSQAFSNIRHATNSNYPMTIFYAFKQAETDNDDESLVDETLPAIASTGWETMLSGLIESGFQIDGTWPIRSEMGSRMVGQGTNALASSIALVCRVRSTSSATITRRDFLAALKRDLPPAFRQLQQGNIAPVDLAQAAIGPGMAVFSRYHAVLESDGAPMHVRTALTLINQALDEYLTEQEGEYDGDTRWALAWYEQFGHNEAAYGVAETLSKAKNTSVQGLVEAGILDARGGKVRLLRREEMDTDWNPEKDKRLNAWEAVQHLIFALDKSGEEAAAALLVHLGGLSETARDLAYRLYTVCERKGWAQDALAYNMLVVAWPRLKELAARQEPGQGKLL